MTTPTAGELTLLRTQPHRTNFYMSIYKPNTVLSCQVTGSAVAKGDRVIGYDSVTEGSYLLVKRGMTLLIGTTAGDDDKGILYVKSATAATITVGENSSVDWAEDDYLTILDFFQIWPVYPRYTSDEEDITVYKDYDVAYSDQNEVLGALVCMGPNHAGFLDSPTGTSSVYYSASGTSNLSTGDLSYHWHFTGNCLPTGSHVQTPGNVLYGEAGHYSAYLTVSGTTGSVETSTRHISIYDRPGEGANVPILSWGVESELSGDRNAGGYSIRLWVKENVDDIQDGALVVLFADDWYGTTKQSIGGHFPNRRSVIFVGYVLGDTISFDYQQSRVLFTVSSPTELMKIVEAFSVSVEDSTNPTVDAGLKGGSPWFYLVGLTMETALYHYIRWNTTINLCCDVEYNATDFNLQFFDADRSSLYNAVNALMESAVLGKTVCDRHGKLWFEVEYEAIDNAATAIPLNMFLDNHDWQGQPSISERVVNSVSFLEMGGVYWQGAVANAFTPMLSSAPGTVPAYRGSPVRLHGHALSSQDQLDSMCGNVYANRNAKYPEVAINLVGNYRNLDIAPQERVTLTMQQRTFRKLDWEQKSFAIRRISWKLDTDRHMMSPSLTLAEIVQGFDGDAIAVPEIPPDEGYSTPIIPIPAFPEFPTITFPTFGSGLALDFIPAVWAYDGYTTDKEDDIRAAIGGNYDGSVYMPATSDILRSAAGFGVSNSDATLVIYAVAQFASTDDGLVSGYNRVRYGGCSVTRTVETVADAFVLPATGGSTTYQHVCFAPITIAVVAGEFLHMTFQRDATGGGDSGTIGFMGWLVVYS